MSATISVVIPCYNAERWIARAIESVAAQPGPPTRTIVVDDGSTDGTPRILAGFGEAITIVSGERRGPGGARNAGLARVESPFVLFLDADDYLEGALLAAMEREIRDRAADAVLAPWLVRFEDAERKDRMRRPPPVGSPVALIAAWLRGEFVPPCSLLWRTEAVRTLGGWDEELRRNEDGELVYRAALAGLAFARVEGEHAVYWQHDSADRVSKQFSEDHVASETRVLGRLADGLMAADAMDATVRAALVDHARELQRLVDRDGTRAGSAAVRRFRRSYGLMDAEGRRPWPAGLVARLRAAGAALNGRVRGRRRRETST